MPDVFGFLVAAFVLVFILVAVVLAGGYQLFQWALRKDRPDPVAVAEEFAAEIDQRIDRALGDSARIDRMIRDSRRRLLVEPALMRVVLRRYETELADVARLADLFTEEAA